MSEKKYCGFDVNGWRDFAQRNWQAMPGDEEVLGPLVLGECGPLSSVVRIGENDGWWLGGKQADVAPHGRSDGWGEVGAEERRLAVRAIIEGSKGGPEEFGAAFAGMASGAAYNVFAIDDLPSTSEDTQERFIEALEVVRFKQPMLVWRPVLAALHAIETGLLNVAQTIGVVCHSPQGISVQKLRLRRTGDRKESVLAPERRRVGELIKSDLGYEHLVHAARLVAIGREGLSGQTAHRALARSVGRLALGMSCAPEVLRDRFANWEVLDLSQEKLRPTGSLSGTLAYIEDCDCVLLETLSEGPIRQLLFDVVSQVSVPRVTVLPPHAVADGAYVAARRAALGQPVYFDFLPRLSTIVFDGKCPVNFDLVEPSETLEAGRVYRSPKPARLSIPAKQANVSVYLRKEAEKHPRKANVKIGQPLLQNTPVSLWVEQKPAAGRARISMEAGDLGRRFLVDWDAAEVDPRDWDEIIAAHETPPPSYPARLVLPCGMQPWDGNTRGSGMAELLQSYKSGSLIDWSALADQMQARPFGEYCVSSDGELPADLFEEDKQNLFDLTVRAMDETRQRLARTRSEGAGENHALRFLTWQFRRCPSEVADWLIECIETRDLEMFRHPFVRHHSSWVLVYQGLGRIVPDLKYEQKIIRLLLAGNVARWNWRQESACMAFLLSRSDTAPKFLERSDVELIVPRVVADFKECLGSEYTKFYYAPFLMAGLLRWRIKEPRGLLLGEDPLAAQLANALERTKADLEGRRRISPALERKRAKYLPILEDLHAELAGDGSNPNLLLDIYGEQD